MKREVLLCSALLTSAIYAQQKKAVTLHPFQWDGKNNIESISKQTTPPQNPEVSSTTYWVPQFEKHYLYNTGTATWDFNDSTRYFYHSTPPAWNGLKKYFIKYFPTANSVNKDTFDYNSLGQEILYKKYTGSNPSSPTYTINQVRSTRYNTNNLEKGKTTYIWTWDTGCFGPMGYRLMPSGKDTTIYNSNNNYIEKQSSFYMSSSCSYAPSNKSTYTRNANDLITEIVSYNFSSGNWVPSQKVVLSYSSNDTLTTVYLLNYNILSSSYDTSGKYTNIQFHYYNKYDLNVSIISSLLYYSYNTITNQYDLSMKMNDTYDSKGNLIASTNYTWTGSSFDTISCYKRVYYYQGSTAQVDSVISSQKTGTNPFVLLDKYIYSEYLQVTGINDLKNKLEVFKMYPVPATTQLNITSNNNAKINTITVLDIHGRNIMSISSIEAGEYTMDVSDLSSGIYLINIIDDKGNLYHSKFVKQ
jgi:hypothetical protein